MQIIREMRRENDNKWGGDSEDKESDEHEGNFHEVEKWRPFWVTKKSLNCGHFMIDHFNSFVFVKTLQEKIHENF